MEVSCLFKTNPVLKVESCGSSSFLRPTILFYAINMTGPSRNKLEEFLPAYSESSVDGEVMWFIWLFVPEDIYVKNIKSPCICKASPVSKVESCGLGLLLSTTRYKH